MSDVQENVSSDTTVNDKTPKLEVGVYGEIVPDELSLGATITVNTGEHTGNNNINGCQTFSDCNSETNQHCNVSNLIVCSEYETPNVIVANTNENLVVENVDAVTETNNISRAIIIVPSPRGDTDNIHSDSLLTNTSVNCYENETTLETFGSFAENCVDYSLGSNDISGYGDPVQFSISELAEWNTTDFSENYDSSVFDNSEVNIVIQDIIPIPTEIQNSNEQTHVGSPNQIDLPPKQNLQLTQADATAVLQDVPQQEYPTEIVPAQSQSADTTTQLLVSYPNTQPYYQVDCGNGNTQPQQQWQGTPVYYSQPGYVTYATCNTPMIDPFVMTYYTTADPNTMALYPNAMAYQYPVQDGSQTNLQVQQQQQQQQPQQQQLLLQQQQQLQQLEIQQCESHEQVFVPEQSESSQSQSTVSDTIPASMPPAGQGSEQYQYPCVYVAQSGLITVLLKHDVSVEMTIDRTIRVVSHQRRLVVATNSRGSASCLYHPGAKICQNQTKTEAELYSGRKALMCTEHILFACEDKCYRFTYDDIEKGEPAFNDISKDNSVSLLFSSSAYGPDHLAECSDLAKKAQYIFYDDGGYTVKINGIKVTQTCRGNVIVTSGPKYLRLSPFSMNLQVQTHFVKMEVDKVWNVTVRRGSHSLNATGTEFYLGNGVIAVELDSKNELKILKLPSTNENKENSSTSTPNDRRWRPHCPHSGQYNKKKMPHRISLKDYM